MKSTFAILVFTSVFVLAKEKHQHREHGSHSHGHADLSIAFDGLNGQIEFKSPAESVVGFEYAPKTDKDKSKLTTAINDFESKITTYIQFDSSLGCKVEKKSIDLVAEGSHADFIAKFILSCIKPVNGTTVTFDFTGLKKLKDIDATVLIEELQLKAEIKSKKTKLEIK
ncbi:MAG: hypothetical protein B7Y39_02400 [Bdellovibrio sp. 28-41-41]|nr:MAG: hypothetical protein B7Y39_02400 [Bdellovibrio sp. 28-41-41]